MSEEAISEESPNEFEQRAMQALCRLLAPDEAEILFVDVLRDARLRSLSTADDLARFSMVLRSRGGVYGAIGGSLGAFAAIKGATAFD